MPPVNSQHVPVIQKKNVTLPGRISFELQLVDQFAFRRNIINHRLAIFIGDA